jgi:hypothetical protein
MDASCVSEQEYRSLHRTTNMSVKREHRCARRTNRPGAESARRLRAHEKRADGGGERASSKRDCRPSSQMDWPHAPGCSKLVQDVVTLIQWLSFWLTLVDAMSCWTTPCNEHCQETLSITKEHRKRAPVPRNGIVGKYGVIRSTAMISTNRQTHGTCLFR